MDWKPDRNGWPWIAPCSLKSWPDFVRTPSGERKRWPTEQLGQAMAHRHLTEGATYGLCESEMKLARPWIPAWREALGLNGRAAGIPDDQCEELLGWISAFHEYLAECVPGRLDELEEDSSLQETLLAAGVAMIEMEGAGLDGAEAWEKVRRAHLSAVDEPDDTVEDRPGLRLLQEAVALSNLAQAMASEVNVVSRPPPSPMTARNLLRGTLHRLALREQDDELKAYLRSSEAEPE